MSNVVVQLVSGQEAITLINDAAFAAVAVETPVGIQAAPEVAGLLGPTGSWTMPPEVTPARTMRTVTGSFAPGGTVCSFDLSAHPLLQGATTAEIFVLYNGVVAPDASLAIAADRASIQYTYTLPFSDGDEIWLKYPAES